MRKLFSLLVVLSALIFSLTQGAPSQFDRGMVEGDTYVCGDPINCCMMAIRCLRSLLQASDVAGAANQSYHDIYLGEILYDNLQSGPPIFETYSVSTDCPYPKCSRGFTPSAGSSHTQDDPGVCQRFLPFVPGMDTHDQYSNLEQCVDVHDTLANGTEPVADRFPRFQNQMSHCMGPFNYAHRMCLKFWVESADQWYNQVDLATDDWVVDTNGLPFG